MHENILQVSFQRRLDYMFTSNTLQEFVTMKKILTPVSTDHSPALLSFSKKGCFRGKGLSKFKSSLSKDQNYISGIKKIDLQFLYRKQVSLQVKCKL